MSPADDVTRTTNLGMPGGKPLDPDVIVPDGDAGLDEDPAQGDEFENEGARLPDNPLGDDDDGDDTETETINGAENDLVHPTKSSEPVVVDTTGGGGDDTSGNARPVSSAFEIDEKHLHSAEDAKLGRAVRGLD